MTFSPRKAYLLCLICGCAFVAGGTWLSSGTMAPYAATLDQPLVIKPCNYLVNTDHPHFVATFLMLDGAPRDQWEFSVLIHRTLFPLLAYPLMKLWGFLVGGIVTSVIIQLAAFAGFVEYVRRKIGLTAALAVIVLLATYPGIYYWSGLPYCYATIVPASLMATLAVREMETAVSPLRVAVLALLLGVLFLGYDLMAYFVPPVILILSIRRRFGSAALAIALMFVPTLINRWLLTSWAGIDLNRTNMHIYSEIGGTYLHPPALMAWARHVSGAPWTLVKAYFYSNFTVLPALFLAAVAANLATRRISLGPTARWILLSGLAIFLFINLAPPHRGWQFRGEGMSRLYQPVFAVMILFIATFLQNAGTSLLVPISLAAIINTSIVLGPATKNPFAAWAYFKFYAHASSPQLLHNLDLYGRRPLGFCNPRLKVKTPAPARNLKRWKPPPATAPASVPSTSASAAALCRDG